ncbi:zf-HIT family C/D snoRNP assembly protein Hit1 [Schizosaccharomyces osmophilus]|uniref:Zf-HIT family C/D snoRNP assembly protein Hit1 n=1 Tax=Schizosaccharomyces osmophilus TaxID=2545709 RepID=A0AAE9WD98_9SCHI|nr:zf-HIT family C/D snoRNP assembly protein Hit1 [Schizosaccharomyces osmophilus]WBW74129.1 zf-HIT family C/D snoRNP assembly protein Hit1 [Schizosaccharomyces osmophilus]
MNKQGCVVCVEGSAKYKCPKCSAPYCSLACYKQHQQQCSATSNNNRDTLEEEKKQQGIVPPKPSPNVLFVNGKYPTIAEEALPTKSQISQAVDDPNVHEMLQSNPEIMASMKRLVELHKTETGPVPLRTLDAIQQNRLHNPDFEQLASYILDKYYHQEENLG